ncbi:hypothetical protein SprV_0200807700 [Sparganum proliferum]
MILRRSDKHFVIDRNREADTVSIGRVEPSYVENGKQASPTQCPAPAGDQQQILATAHLRFATQNLTVMSTGPTSIPSLRLVFGASYGSLASVPFSDVRPAVDGLGSRANPHECR